uniref:Uncharacterized protein n=1 Tax=uncultured marine virus TaxID=186617 RepID=A0A0F7L7Y8_9VIRU|nr:hypothetical protein [uncultured marine virus]
MAGDGGEPLHTLSQRRKPERPRYRARNEGSLLQRGCLGELISPPPRWTLAEEAVDDGFHGLFFISPGRTQVTRPWYPSCRN